MSTTAHRRDTPARGAERLARQTTREIAALESENARLRARVADVEAEHRARARETLEHLAHSTDGWFWETDADLRFTYMTLSVEQITGVPPEWHYGKTREDLGTPDTVSEHAWNAHLAALTRREPFRDFVFQRTGPDGARWLKTSGVPVFDHSGTFDGYRGTAVDITAEFTARRTAERLLSAIENLSDLFVLWDANDRLVMCNARFREINATVAETTQPGVSFEQHIRAALAAGLYPQARGCEEAWFEERMTRHRDPQGGIELERQDGRWLLIQEHVLADRSTATISTDITERKRAEQKLAEKHAMLDAALGTIPDGVQVLDAELNLVAWNQRLWSVMDLDEAAITGSPNPGKAFRYALARRGEYGAGDIDERVASREAIARTNAPVHYERQLTCGKWIECRGTPVPGGGYIALYRDIDESKRLQGELERLASFDALTGLTNRRRLFDILDRELARTRRLATPLTVMVIDADHFKRVNDRHGHGAGDHVLQVLARTLQEQLREIDTLARLGGEEFAVVLPECTLADAGVVAERLRAAAAARAIVWEGTSIVQTVSVGLAAARSEDDVHEVLARADQALYVAKGEGRNRVVSADER